MLSFPAQLGIGLGLGAINYLTGKKDKVKNPYVNPSQYRNDLLMTPQNISMLRNQAMQNVNSGLMVSQNRIGQMAAANRMPAGAALSGMAGAQYEAGRGAASIEPQIAEQKRRSFMDYINLQNQYGQGQMQVDQMNQQNRGLMGDTLGMLTKLAMLYNSGYFGGDQQQDQGINPNPQQTRYQEQPLFG